MDKAAAHALLLRVQHHPLCADFMNRYAHITYLFIKKLYDEEEPQGSIVLRGIRLKGKNIRNGFFGFNVGVYKRET